MHTLDPVAIGGRIREVRGAATQAQFATRLGVGRVSVARYETGERTPDAEFIAKINSAYGVDPMWLLLGVSNVPTSAHLPPSAREPAPATYQAQAEPAPPGLAPPADLSTRERELIERYRAASERDRRIIDGVALQIAEREQRLASESGPVSRPVRLTRRKLDDRGRKHGTNDS